MSCQEERSQVQNRARCMQMLASKLYEIEPVSYTHLIYLCAFVLFLKNVMNAMAARHREKKIMASDAAEKRCV